MFISKHWIFNITKQQFEILEECISMLFSKMNALQQDPAKLDAIRALESQVDRIEDKLTEAIFAGNTQLAEKMQAAEIIEQLGDISDRIEDIADKIQIMVIARKA